MSHCEIREGLEAKVAEAYKAVAELKSPHAVRHAQRKVTNLLKQMHAHVDKHGCLRQEKSE